MRLALPLPWPAFASVASAYAGSQGNEMSSATSKMFCSIATPSSSAPHLPLASPSLVSCWLLADGSTIKNTGFQRLLIRD
uniref:Putative secreted protein n=1 Tax=Anopheles triannulatus TaxID=58253 RepID=A0A2M4B3E9_9DIPT